MFALTLIYLIINNYLYNLYKIVCIYYKKFNKAIPIP